jgi:hypothetical protein
VTGAARPRQRGRGAGLASAAALSLAVALFASPVPARAQAPPQLDLDAWLASLDAEQPASGDWALYGGGPPIDGDAAAAMHDGLWSGDPRAVSVAVDELFLYGVPAGESLLLQFARSGQFSGLDDDLRRAVLRALREMRSGRALPLFARVALREEGGAADEAIRALCESLAPEAGPVLRELVREGERHKAKQVIRWLRKAGEREAARAARGERREERREDRQERREERREEREERKEERREERE